MHSTLGRIARILTGAALLGVLASCGGTGTGETATTTQTAAPPTQAPATQQPLPKTLILQVDTVRGPAGLTDAEKAYLSCIQENRYPQGTQIVWRAKVFDPATGKAMDDKALTSVTLTLPDATTKTLKYGPHGPKDAPTDIFWTTSFTLPKDYPTGAFNYKLDATAPEGRTGSYSQFNMAVSMLQVVPAGKP